MVLLGVHVHLEPGLEVAEVPHPVHGHVDPTGHVLLHLLQLLGSGLCRCELPGRIGLLVFPMEGREEGREEGGSEGREMDRRERVAREKEVREGQVLNCQ